MVHPVDINRQDVPTCDDDANKAVMNISSILLKNISPRPRTLQKFSELFCGGYVVSKTHSSVQL